VFIKINFKLKKKKQVARIWFNKCLGVALASCKKDLFVCVVELMFVELLSCLGACARLGLRRLWFASS